MQCKWKELSLNLVNKIRAILHASVISLKQISSESWLQTTTIYFAHKTIGQRFELSSPNLGWPPSASTVSWVLAAAPGFSPMRFPITQKASSGSFMVKEGKSQSAYTF